MMHSLVADKDSEMWFFRKSKRETAKDEKYARQEEEIQETRKQIYENIDRAAKSSRKVGELLEDRKGVTYLIYLATGQGGERRKNGKR